ncbi:uncharacterized protein LOC108471483 [Gossypium arboreum]|uniref:uncharacterized protein LOC108471483 n=1 Tax=Gossypium arboreum TaxID=29729 RepID=UPI000819073A|nr:uncharacterized protein LOC108471483 [Gossypium arboreum]
MRRSELLFDMAPLKAPGSNDFHALFFQSQREQEQARFIEWQNITDNIILAQEAIHSMRSKKKNKKWMVVKIDLEKAYDRVLWEFIDASLKATSIPDLLRNVVMSTISNSTMQILWNGVPS